jgi:hypothetical protein
MNSRGDQGVGTRRRAAVVRVWLEVYVECAAAGIIARSLKSEYFGVLHALIGVNALAGDVPLSVDDDRTDVGIWRSQAHALACEI